MKFIFMIFVLSYFSSCKNHINEYTVVKSVSMNILGKEKYRVELEFYFENQYLYTDSSFNVGDTLWLSKYNNK